MALRITQGMMYGSMVGGMNKNLSDLMESNMQSASQKKINRPSDDPVGAGRVISYRSSLDKIKTYDNNIKQAMGWLGIADSTLGSGDGSVQAVLTRLMTLAEQGSSGTYDANNREQISFELRQDFMQLINLANTTFEGRSIFAGHKTEAPAYVEGLGVTCVDPNSATPTSIATSGFHVEGGTAKTVVIQAVIVPPPGRADAATYRYSSDSGKTWQNATTSTASGHLVIDAGGVKVHVDDGSKIVNAVDQTNEHSNNNGTWLYVRPTAIYKGDDNDTQVMTPYDAAGLSTTRTGTATGSVTISSITGAYPDPVSVEVLNVGATIDYRYSSDGGTSWTTASVPAAPGNELNIPGGLLELSAAPVVGDTFLVNPSAITAISGQAAGYFTRDVAVRIDDNRGNQLTYSYSLDDGSNWTQATTPLPASPIPLPVPGGYLNLSTLPVENSQFIIHPHRADINFQISDTDNITVNMVGKDIFGGLYDYPGDTVGHPVPVTGLSANIFEIVGNLVAAAETNSQQGMQEGLAALKEAMNVVLTKTAVVGGRENRLITTQAALTMRAYNETDNLSEVEDVDVTVLTVRLAQQQVAYNSVLKSSSMIMQMSLVNFL